MTDGREERTVGVEGRVRHYRCKKSVSESTIVNYGENSMSVECADIFKLFLLLPRYY